MRIDIPSFRGMAPRIAPRGLPNNAAQRAVNARMLGGDLEAWRQFLAIVTLPQAPQTIYLLGDDTWLSWLTDVDVARGLIPGDTTLRVYLTGPDEYPNPRWTNLSLATSSPGSPAPVVTRPLGVPNPDTIPVVTRVPATVSATPDVEVVDEGDLDNWVVTPPVSGGFDNGDDFVAAFASSASPTLYRLFHDAGANLNFRSANAYRDFGVASSSGVFFEGDFRMTGAVDAVERRMLAHVAVPADGNGIVVWYSEVAAAGKLNIGRNGGGWGIVGDIAGAIETLAVVEVGALTGPLSVNGANITDPNYGGAVGWYHLEVTVSAPNDDEQTVTASLYDGQGGTTLLGTVSATGRFGLGGFCGMSFAHPYDSGVAGLWIDWANIHVTGEGERGLVILEVPTNYVFTYVNDVGEESGIYLPSATVVRPDGAAVSVVTSVSLPAYLTDEYFIVAKRIYRSVDGNVSAAFVFVAEIPLEQAEYIDTLSDSELGDPLETELYALPPDNMRGIIALPNGIMAGFFGNQLCLSARNNPHAWPVEYRLPTDTDIVAIAHIDGIVVLATESFPYLAGGKDPAAFSMRKLDQVKQACTSKRSMAVLSNFGAVYASPDGLIAITAGGQDRNLTETIFTRTQWQALDPTRILGIVHDDVYHFWYMGSAGIVSFYDTFEGPVSALSLHSPDVSPSYVWSGTNLVLSGSGQVFTDDGGFRTGTAQDVVDNRTLPTDAPFVLVFTWRPEEVTSPFQDAVTVRVVGGSIAVTVTAVTATEVNVFSSFGGGVNEAVAVTTFVVGVARTFRVEVRDTGWELSEGGVPLASGPQVLLGTTDSISIGVRRFALLDVRVESL